MTRPRWRSTIVEVRKPEIDATLVAESIAQQLERRVAFRRAMKRAVQSAMRLGGPGHPDQLLRPSGGAEIARMEWYREGRVPLHTLRGTSITAWRPPSPTYGTCGDQGLDLQGRDPGAGSMAQDKR
jgi:small subunit ribosomal protein S3